MKTVAESTSPGRLFLAERLRGLSSLFVSACLMLAAGARPARAGQSQNPQTLTPGESLSRQMRGGETHLFQIPLPHGQYLHVVVEQQAIDVAVKVYAPGGSVVAEADSPNGLVGPEAVSVVAVAPGDYKIEVTSDKTAPPGSYRLQVEGPREATPADGRRVEAERTFAEAQKLRREGSDESRARAIEKYKAARDIWRELGDARGEGYALCGIGRTYRTLGKLAETLEFMGEAASRLEAAQDISGLAFVLNEVGAAHRKLGDPLEALKSYERALTLRNSIGDIWGEAQLLNNIGLTYSNTGQQQKAIEQYGRALALWRATGDRYMEANTRNNVGLAYSELGDLTLALNDFQQALQFCREVGDSHLEAFVLNNIGRIYDSWGEAETALSNYDDALTIFRRLEDTEGEAMVLENIGMVHAGLGDPQRALEYFNKALPIRQQRNEPRGLAFTLTNIAYAYTLQEKHLEALKYLDLALPLSRQARNRTSEAYGLIQQGMLYVSLHEPRKALEYYRQALDIQTELGDRRGQAIALDKIGQANAELGELSQALDFYGQALQLWTAVGDKQGQALTLYGVARVERDRLNFSNARDRAEEAIDIVESLRQKMTAQQLRMTYFAGRQDLYELAINIRMRLYELTRSEADLEAALSISERGRARNLLDLLVEARSGVGRGLSPQDAERNRRLDQEISLQMQTLLSLRNLRRAEDAAAVEQRVAALINEEEELQSKARPSGRGTDEAGQAQPMRARDVQQLLDDDTLLLEYALGERSSYLWVVTRTKIVPHVLPGRSEIEEAARKLRQQLTANEPSKPGESPASYLSRLKEAKAQYGRLSLDFSRMLLGPAWAQVGNKRLVVVADGALRYIPFEALPAPDTANVNQTATDPAGSLLTKSEVIYLPSASALALLREAPRRNTSKTVAVIADPVFDSSDRRVRASSDGRKSASAARPLEGAPELNRALRDVGDVGGEDFKLERLAHSAEEADAITANAPQGSWMKAVGFQASRATALSPGLRQYSVVHFATHGIINDRHPSLSGIVLSLVNERGQPEDGYLRLRDIYNLDLPVELVVLSACRTGIGKDVRGEGLVGMTQGFMYAGARRVVASLWKVNDEATAELMKRFYRHLLGKNRLTASAALRQAKIEMMGAGEQWRAPYYWAGFVLQGDWK